MHEEDFDETGRWIEASPQPVNRRTRVVSVSRLTRDLKQAVESVFFNCNVEGEITGTKLYDSGHAYFSLKDEAALIRCVVWASHRARLPFRLTDGKKVVVHGDVQVYAPKGSYQLVVRQVWEAGLGEHLLALERLKRRLTAEGLFDPERKRPLPPNPSRIGIVTAEKSAALRDILSTIQRRFPTSVMLAPCRVQGNDAVETLCKALDDLQQAGDVDVIIVGRGGGSAEDLRAFNDERVVRAIASCKIPTVSAVGHETDHMLTDLVADVRAATPTAAAEIVVPDQRPLRRRGSSARQRLFRCGERLVGEARQRWDGAYSRLLNHRKRSTDLRRQKLLEVQGRLNGLHPARRLETEVLRLKRLQEQSALALVSQLKARRQRLEGLERTLYALSPRGSLGRGYAIVRDGTKGRVLSRAEDAAVGDMIEVMLQSGTLWATVTRIEGSKEETG